MIDEQCSCSTFTYLQDAAALYIITSIHPFSTTADGAQRSGLRNGHDGQKDGTIRNLALPFLPLTGLAQACAQTSYFPKAVYGPTGSMCFLRYYLPRISYARG
jgi:hypothetical protein